MIGSEVDLGFFECAVLKEKNFMRPAGGFSIIFPTP